MLKIRTPDTFRCEDVTRIGTDPGLFEEFFGKGLIDDVAPDLERMMYADRYCRSIRRRPEFSGLLPNSAHQSYREMVNLLLNGHYWIFVEAAALAAYIPFQHQSITPWLLAVVSIPIMAMSVWFCFRGWRSQRSYFHICFANGVAPRMGYGSSMPN